MDPLSPVFSRLALSARVFYAGPLCGSVEFETGSSAGILHVLRSGRAVVHRPHQTAIELSEPSVIFHMQPGRHRLEVTEASGADLLCAFVRFGGGSGNALIRGLPEPLVLPTAANPAIDGTLGLLFGEAVAQRPGRDAAVDRLMEYVVVLMLRHVIEHSLVNGGVFAALGDARLAKAINAMHDDPARPWTLEQLATSADMSRARFAARFREVVGSPAMDYLTEFRMSVAQALLKRGRPVKVVAGLVGYTNTAAFVRAFARRVGRSPGKSAAE